MSDKIRIILYKSKWFDGHAVDNLISLWTRSKYSHVEIWLPDGQYDIIPDPQFLPDCDTRVYGKFVYMDSMCWYPVGTCATSTMRGEDNGTVSRPAFNVIENPYRWDYFEIEVPEMDAMMGYMNQEVANNKGYAKRDLWKFVIGGLHRPDDTRNICSEFVDTALWYGGVYGYGGIVSPEEVYQKLIALGHEAKSLG